MKMTCYSPIHLHPFTPKKLQVRRKQEYIVSVSDQMKHTGI